MQVDTKDSTVRDLKRSDFRLQFNIISKRMVKMEVSRSNGYQNLIRKKISNFN